MSAQPRKRGRPSQDREEVLQVRLTAAEKERYEVAAKKYGLSLSDWVRVSLSAVSKPQTMQQPLVSFHGTNE